jgi:hypothetical protein
VNPVSSLARTCERRCSCSRRRNYVAPPPTFLRLFPCEIHNRAVFSRLCEGSIRLERHTIRRAKVAFALSHALSCRIISRRLAGRSGRMWGAWHPRGSRGTVFQHCPVRVPSAWLFYRALLPGRPEVTVHGGRARKAWRPHRIGILFTRPPPACASPRQLRLPRSGTCVYARATEQRVPVRRSPSMKMISLPNHLSSLPPIRGCARARSAVRLTVALLSRRFHLSFADADRAVNWESVTDRGRRPARTQHLDTQIFKYAERVGRET